MSAILLYLVLLIGASGFVFPRSLILTFSTRFVHVREITKEWCIFGQR
jgi:hypothetical protein